MVGLQQPLCGFRGGGVRLGLPQEEEEEAAHQADDGEGDEDRLTVLVWRQAAEVSGQEPLRVAEPDRGVDTPYL